MQFGFESKKQRMVAVIAFLAIGIYATLWFLHDGGGTALVWRNLMLDAEIHPRAVKAFLAMHISVVVIVYALVREIKDPS